MSTSASFQTEGEARDYIKNKRYMDKLYFCPLIKTRCSIDCICFIEPEIESYAGLKFGVTLPYCNSPLITGRIEVANDQSVFSIEDIHK